AGWQGRPIGPGRRAIPEGDARTTCRTSRLARALSSVRYEAATLFDGGHVRGARESVTIDGKAERAEATIDGASYTSAPDAEPRRVPGGTELHTLHSALGVLRTWSKTA